MLRGVKICGIAIIRGSYPSHSYRQRKSYLFSKFFQSFKKFVGNNKKLKGNYTNVTNISNTDFTVIFLCFYIEINVKMCYNKYSKKVLAWI